MSDAVVLLDHFPALAGVDLDVARGEIVLLRGPNGAGKTTLLRTCAGLARVVPGTVEVLGSDVVAPPRSVRRRGGDRKGVVWGKSESGRVDTGGRRIIKKK